MPKSLLFGIGVAAGAMLAYLFDPDRGRSRRARLADQAAARSRDVSDSMKKTAEYQKGVARGVIHDVADALRTERDYDDETLMQKVRSEALGYWDGSDDIQIDITDGMVQITGSVDDEAARARLIDLIRHVDGVSMIDDRLRVAT